MRTLAFSMHRNGHMIRSSVLMGSSPIILFHCMCSEAALEHADKVPESIFCSRFHINLRSSFLMYLWGSGWSQTPGLPSKELWLIKRDIILSPLIFITWTSESTENALHIPGFWVLNTQTRPFFWNQRRHLGGSSR